MTRAKLKKQFKEKGLVNCELKLNGCWYNNGLSFAHRHKRKEYWSRPGKLGDFNQVVLACAECHDQIENNEELTEELFIKLRGKDNLYED